MKSSPIALLLLLAPTAALACAPGEALVFSCPTDKGKQVEVCQGPGTIQYTFGEAGQPPELKLSEENGKFMWDHGEGVSTGIADDLQFHHGETTYAISHVRSYDDPSDVIAHLSVRQPGKEGIYIDCAAGKVKFNPEAIKAMRREMSEGAPSG